MTQTPNSRPMRRTLPLLLAAALLAAGADLVTKSWAQAMLAGQPPIPLLGETLRLHLGFNRVSGMECGNSTGGLGATEAVKRN